MLLITDHWFPSFCYSRRRVHVLSLYQPRRGVCRRLLSHPEAGREPVSHLPHQNAGLLGPLWQPLALR